MPGTELIRINRGLSMKLRTAVNDYGFHGSMPASLIVQACTPYLGDEDTIAMPIELYGQLHKPGGDIVIMRETHELTITEDLTNLVSAATVLFYLDPEDVDITVREMSEVQL